MTVLVTAVLEYLESAFHLRGHATISYFHCVSIMNTARLTIRGCGHHDQVNRLLRGVVCIRDAGLTQLQVLIVT